MNARCPHRLSLKILIRHLFIRCSIGCLVFCSSTAQERTAYPDIPRIDVHTHVSGDLDGIGRYLELREVIKERHDVEFAMWINLGSSTMPIGDLDSVMRAGKGRMLCCISDYTAHNGLQHDPTGLSQWLDRGYVGYKIWSGPADRVFKPGEKGFPYIDDPAHEPTFAMMERIGFGMVGASVHVADPCGPWGNRTQWLSDPVEYWRQITAWTEVLKKHPELVVVNAHGMWAMCQDAQIDYLRYMLATFPGLNVDLAATFQYFYMVNRDNLRSFMIEYSDRVLFATDIGRWDDDEKTAHHVQRYFQCFQILETDNLVPGGFFSQNETRGLELPREVLERIYFRNAMRIYPRVKDAMMELGYSVD